MNIVAQNNIPVYEFSRILRRVERKGDDDAWNMDSGLIFPGNEIFYNIKFYSYIRSFFAIRYIFVN